MKHRDEPWHSDPSRLLDEVRQTRDHWAFLPEIAGYTGLLEIGRGGQGVVYRARQSSTNRLVAVKIMLHGALASDESRSRFQREIEIAATLHHDHIVRVLDRGTMADGHLYFIMEYVDGTPLVGSADTQHVHDLVAILPLFSDLCQAVLYAHQRGVVHRDLKGTNILVDDDGDPHILDFGLASITPGTADASTAPTAISLTGQILGSLPWASPEQLQGDPSAVDTRADIYALGVILYRLITGVFPHDVTSNLQDTLHRIVHVEPARPRAIRASIPDELDAITLHCLSKNPDDRYATVDELLRDVNRFRQGEPIEARRRVAWNRATRTIKRYRSMIFATGAAAALTLILAVTMSVLYQRAVDAESLATSRLTEAEQQADRARNITAYIKSILLAVDPSSTRRQETTIRGMLDSATARLSVRLANDPLARAEISVTLGNAYFNLGAVDSAEAVLIEAVTIYRTALKQALKDDRSEVVEGTCAALLGLGRVRAHQGRLAEAEQLRLEVLGLSSEHPGRMGGANYQATLDLANLALQRGEILEAEKVLESIGNDPQAATRTWSAPRLIAQHELGRVRTSLGKYDVAETELREARDGLITIHGPSNMHVARCETSLADCLNRVGRFDEARQLAQAALKVNIEQLGPHHQQVIEAQEILATALNSLGDTAAAETLFNEALATCRTVFGDQHTQVAHLLERIGTFYLEHQRIDEAERSFREAFAMYTALLPADHLDCIITEGKVGACFAAAERFEEAAPILRSVTEALARQLDDEHPLVVYFRSVRDLAESHLPSSDTPESG